MQALSQLSYTPNRSTISRNFLRCGKPQIIGRFSKVLQARQNIFFTLQLKDSIETRRLSCAHDQHTHRHGQLRHFQTLLSEHFFDHCGNGRFVPVC